MQPFFSAVDGGREGDRFCLYHAPSGDRPALGALVYVHPFAEEMNKSRRMVAMQARALARAGCAVLQIDLAGCGDSSGDFDQVTWDDWVTDVAWAARWLGARHAGPITLWGLRSGCLVAADAARQLDVPVNFLFWQPPSAGKALLQQFLRLRTAGRMLEGKSDGGMAALRAALAGGETLEVAGYLLGAAWADGLERARLRPPAHGGASHWFEVSTRHDAEPLPATTLAADAWRAAGHDVSLEVVTGPAFWQTQELEDAPALIAATTAALAGTRATA